MSYVDYEYYTKAFAGISIPMREFVRLAETASDVIDAASVLPIRDHMVTDRNVKRATCYQIEFMYQAGGLDAVGPEGGEIQTERLDTYSIGVAAQNVSPRAKNQPVIGGVNMSTMALSCLKKAGLMEQWYGAEVALYGGENRSSTFDDGCDALPCPGRRR